MGLSHWHQQMLQEGGDIEQLDEQQPDYLDSLARRPHPARPLWKELGRSARRPPPVLRMNVELNAASLDDGVPYDNVSDEDNVLPYHYDIDVSRKSSPKIAASQQHSIAGKISLSVPSYESIHRREGMHCPFFSLPAELRNHVYQLVALSTHVTLPQFTRYRRRLIRGPGLLRASSQTRREFLPIMCANANVSIYLRELDFDHLAATASGLESFDLHRSPGQDTSAPLLENPRLQLVLIHPYDWSERTWKTRFHEWISHICSSKVRVSWKYRVEQSWDDEIRSYKGSSFLGDIGMSELCALKKNESRQDVVVVLDKLISAFEDEGERVDSAVRMLWRG